MKSVPKDVETSNQNDQL